MTKEDVSQKENAPRDIHLHNIDNLTYSSVNKHVTVIASSHGDKAREEYRQSVNPIKSRFKSHLKNMDCM